MSSSVRILSDSVNSAQVIDTVPNRISGWHISNDASTLAYVKFYDTNVAPTAGQGTPKLTLLIPDSVAGGVTEHDFTSPLQFQNGIGVCITGGAADTDTVACAADQIIINLFRE